MEKRQPGGMERHALQTPYELLGQRLVRPRAAASIGLVTEERMSD
jgi:hypothetical protein